MWLPSSTQNYGGIPTTPQQAFAQTYLNTDVMLVYAKRLLEAYKALFEDMDEYMAKVGDPGDSRSFWAHTAAWQSDWRTVVVPQQR